MHVAAELDPDFCVTDLSRAEVYNLYFFALKTINQHLYTI